MLNINLNIILIKATKKFIFLQSIIKSLYRSYSTSSAKPVVTYYNCETEKDRILNENKGKAVIYRWVNNLNGKTYVFCKYVCTFVLKLLFDRIIHIM